MDARVNAGAVRSVPRILPTVIRRRVNATANWAIRAEAVTLARTATGDPTLFQNAPNARVT